MLFRNRRLQNSTLFSKKMRYEISGSTKLQNDKSSAKLVVIVHLYYSDLWPTLRARLNRIQVPFDLVISVQKTDENIQIEQINAHHGTTYTVTLPNKGRDVLPFLEIARELQRMKRYEYFLKLHSKKSPHRRDGTTWFETLLDELIPADISRIIDTLDDSSTGAVGPASHVVSLSRYMGDNEDSMRRILSAIASRKIADSILLHREHFPFFGGTMFWARLDYIQPILKSKLSSADFEDEGGQVDGTFAHALERVFGRALHTATKKKMYTVDETGAVRALPDGPYVDEYQHVG